MTDLNIIIKIEKLLAMAGDSGCTPEEREAFHEKAMEMMHEHRLTQADVGGNLAADDKLVNVKFGQMDGTYGRVRLNLLAGIADGFDVKTYWLPRGNKRTAMLYGFKSDVDAVVALANRLIADADMRAKLLTADPAEYASAQQAAAGLIRERRGFYLGYASEIADRLCRTRAAAEKVAAAAGVNVESAALVLVDRAKQVHDGLRRDVSIAIPALYELLKDTKRAGQEHQAWRGIEGKALRQQAES